MGDKNEKEEKYEVVRLEVAKLDLKPGDVLIIQSDKINQRQVDFLYKFFSDFYADRGIKVMVTSRTNLELSVIHKEEANEAISA